MTEATRSNRSRAASDVVVLVEADDTRHASFVDDLRSTLAPDHTVEVVRIRPLERAVPLDARVLDTLDRRQQAALYTAPVVISLTTRCKLTASDLRQRYYSLCDWPNFVAHGLPIVNAGAWESDTDHLRGLVFGAERAERYRLDETVVAFDATTPGDEWFEAFWSTEEQAVMAALTAPRRPRHVLFVDSFADLGHLGAELTEWFRSEIAADRLDVWMISKISGYAIGHIGFPCTRYVHEPVYSSGLRVDDLDPTDVVYYPAFGRLLASGLLSHDINCIYLPNLELLSMRGPVDQSTILELASDPGAFHMRTLEEIQHADGRAPESVDIIIPHHNTGLDLIQRALRSALDCRSEVPELGVIVVDDGSTTDLEPPLAAHFRAEWNQVRFVRQPNAGPGPARNRGVALSDADYVYFLDADDEIFVENMAKMVAQAQLADSDMTVGKRIIVDSDGNYLDESLEYIFGAVARVLTKPDARVVDDHMITNKLIRRQTILDYDLWIPDGTYEDNRASMLYYGASLNTSMLNLPIHRWYQYEANESITKTKNYANARNKIRSLVASWQLLLDPKRQRRITYNLNYDLQVLLDGAAHLSESEQAEIHARVRAYTRDANDYIDEARLTSAGVSLLRATRRVGPLPSFGAHTKEDTPTIVDEAAGYVFFPRTYFQVIEALAMTVHSGWASTLVVPDDLPGFDDDTVPRIRASGIFREVRTYSSDAVVSAFAAKVRLGSAGTASMLRAVLSAYTTALGDLPKGATGVYFHDPWPENYFIRSHFARTYKMEDGYRSTVREFELSYRDGTWGHNIISNGLWGRLNLQIQQHLHELYPHRPGVDRYYVGEPAGADAVREYEPDADVQVVDVKELLNLHSDRLRAPLVSMFGGWDVDAASTVVLTQPLFFDYCSPEDHLTVVAHLVGLAGSGKVYLKPHPMDPYDYTALGVEVIDPTIPFEILEASGASFSHGIAFGTSALDNSSAVSTTTLLMPFSGFGPDDVRDRIDELCAVTHSTPAAQALITSNSTSRSVAASPPTIIIDSRQYGPSGTQRKWKDARSLGYRIVRAVRVLGSDPQRFGQLLRDRVKNTLRRR